VRSTKRKRRDGVWEIRAYVGRDPLTGKPRQLSKTVYGSAKVANAVLRDLLDRQAPTRADGLGLTVGQLIDRWLEECERLDLSPTTMRNYRAQIERTVRPAIGKVSPRATHGQAARRPLRLDEDGGPVTQDNP
jgi:hypothetical protein